MKKLTVLLAMITQLSFGASKVSVNCIPNDPCKKNSKCIQTITLIGPVRGFGQEKNYFVSIVVAQDFDYKVHCVSLFSN